MFPNKYNIYLHDTPQKHLFDHETRAYSHGCIRLQQPFDFAYALLARQEADPEGAFHRILNTGRETKVNLEVKVPVHIIYRTAVTEPKGHTNYRADVYGRDARIWDALERAGVSLPGVRGKPAPNAGGPSCPTRLSRSQMRLGPRPWAMFPSPLPACPNRPTPRPGTLPWQ